MDKMAMNIKSRRDESAEIDNVLFPHSQDDDGGF